jgi:hypothetical protein
MELPMQIVNHDKTGFTLRMWGASDITGFNKNERIRLGVYDVNTDKYFGLHYSSILYYSETPVEAGKYSSFAIFKTTNVAIGNEIILNYDSDILISELTLSLGDSINSASLSRRYTSYTVKSKNVENITFICNPGKVRYGKQYVPGIRTGTATLTVFGFNKWTKGLVEDTKTVNVYYHKKNKPTPPPPPIINMGYYEIFESEYFHIWQNKNTIYAKNLTSDKTYYVTYKKTYRGRTYNTSFRVLPGKLSGISKVSTKAVDLKYFYDKSNPASKIYLTTP